MLSEANYCSLAGVNILYGVYFLLGPNKVCIAHISEVKNAFCKINCPTMFSLLFSKFWKFYKFCLNSGTAVIVNLADCSLKMGKVRYLKAAVGVEWMQSHISFKTTLRKPTSWSELDSGAVFKDVRWHQTNVLISKHRSFNGCIDPKNEIWKNTIFLTKSSSRKPKISVTL